MPSNATWLCFDCRAAMRRPVLDPGPVACSRCGKDAIPCGTRTPVPPKQDLDAWRDLRQRIMQMRREIVELDEVRRARRRHRVERQILALESRPVSDSRQKAIRRLRDELGQSS